MNKNETNIAVEVIAKCYATSGTILTISNSDLSDRTNELVKSLKARTTKVHPLSISYFKPFLDNGLKDEFQSMHKILRIINLNNRKNEEDLYNCSSELLAFSQDNLNNLLVIVKNNESFNEDVKIIIKVAKAIGIDVLAIDSNEDFNELSVEVESYLFK